MSGEYQVRLYRVEWLAETGYVDGNDTGYWTETETSEVFLSKEEAWEHLKHHPDVIPDTDRMKYRSRKPHGRVRVRRSERFLWEMQAIASIDPEERIVNAETHRRETMSAPELKPCPFCGGPAELWPARTNNWVRARVKCLGNCERTSTNDYKTTDEAVEAWNCRTSDALEERVKELETVISALDKITGITIAYHVPLGQSLARLIRKEE